MPVNITQIGVSPVLPAIQHVINSVESKFIQKLTNNPLPGVTYNGAQHSSNTQRYGISALICLDGTPIADLLIDAIAANLANAVTEKWTTTTDGTQITITDWTTETNGVAPNQLLVSFYCSF
jgi:hypothetical protein